MVDLHPELKEHLHESGIGPILQHPLVYCVPYAGVMNEMLNQQFEHKKALVEKAVQEQQWSRMLGLYERPWRWWALYEHCLEMSVQSIAENFAWVWTDSENVYQNVHIIVQLLNIIDDSRLVMNEEDRKTFDAMPDEFTVYRGCTERNAGGMSWTLNREKAEWFANRLLQPGDKCKVLDAKVKKEHVLFYTNARGEQEIVLEPAEEYGE